MDDSFGNSFSRFSRLIRQERPYHSTHHHSMQSCIENVTDEFLCGAIVGGTLSGLAGMFAMARACRLRQIRFPAAVQAVVGATIADGLSFGVPLATWQGAVGSMMRVREVDDLINPIIAVGFVGAMIEIPVYVHGKVVAIKAQSAILGGQGPMHVMRRTRPLFLTGFCVGACLGGEWYIIHLRQQNELARSQGSPQPPQAPSHGSQEQQELVTWNSSESQENNGDWGIAEPSSGELLESHGDLSWGSK